MKKYVSALVAAGVMAVAAPASAATIVNLNAADLANSTATLNLVAGRYDVSLVKGLYTAWSARRVGIDANGANIPGPNWVDYFKYTVNGVTTTYPISIVRYATPDNALAAYSAFGPVHLTLTAPTTVTFAIADAASSLHDNSGGVSLSISAVPEPATWAMMIAGVGLAGGALRRKSRGTRMATATA